MSGKAFIQYKGFDVCADIKCGCGEQYHIDAEFAYFVRCSACGAIYRMPGAFEFDDISRVDESPDWATVTMRDDGAERLDVGFEPVIMRNGGVMTQADYDEFVEHRDQMQRDHAAEVARFEDEMKAERNQANARIAAYRKQLDKIRDILDGEL